MIDLTSEVQTVHAFIYVARATKAFTKYCFRDPDSDYCDAVGAIYHQFGQEQGGETGQNAVAWGMRNVELHAPTVQFLIELNDDIFADMTPELRRDAMLHTMTEYAHIIYVENANLEMYGRKY